MINYRFIIKEYSPRLFGKVQHKAMLKVDKVTRAYAQSGQYHTCGESTQTIKFKRKKKKTILTITKQVGILVAFVG